jgi:hypothetical protein
MLAQFMQRVSVERRDGGVCPSPVAQPAEDTSMQERDDSRGTPPEEREREYGESGRYAGQGELNEGYGQGQDMAEDQWSGERYHQQAEQVDRDMLDQDEPRAGDTSDVDQMVGGMTGVQQPPDVVSGQSGRQDDSDVMSDLPEDEDQETLSDDWQG